MKIRQILVMTVVALALTACRGEHATMTGAYGSGVVTGEVVMAVAGSPAGVEVSVRGTGMNAVLGEDGRFAFASVPENATLDFRRATDGISASLPLDKMSSNMVIELSRSEARHSSKRRGVSRSTNAYEFEGVVRSATADSIVVFTSHQEEVTIGLTATTGIRKGDKVLTAADLVPDTRVHVKALKADDAYTAALIIVQSIPGEDDGEDGTDGGTVVEAKEYEGLVRSAAADQLVIFDSHGQEVTFVLTADTTVRKGDTPILPADIQVGWRAHVRATTNATDGTKTATLVIVQNENTHDEDEVELMGVVATVGTTDLTVTTAMGVVTIQTDASTKIEKRDQTIALADVKVGDRVKVEATKVDATTYLAKSIEVK